MARRRLQRLQRGAQTHLVALQESWTREAFARLSTPDLKHMRSALRREEHVASEEFPQLPLSPEEQAAFERFNECYEEVRRGS